MIALRKWCLGSLLATAGIVSAAWTMAAQKPAAPEIKIQPRTQQPDPRREAILKRAKAFMEAFNNQDAGKVAALFTEEAELVERNGDVIRGRKKIQAAFAEIFKETPQNRISLAVDSVRFVARGVAIEEGRLTSFPDGKTASHESRYQVVHVNTNGRWLMAHARTLETTTLSHHEHLKELSWMIGQWVNEDDDSVVETTGEWSKNKNFLLRKFTVKIKDEPAMSGVQRIGWDPLTKQFKSWVFDSEGGHAEGLWSRVGNNWVIKARGVNRDGTVVTSTNQFSTLGKDRMQWVSVHRLAGNEHLPDISVIIVRKPPKPAK